MISEDDVDLVSALASVTRIALRHRNEKIAYAVADVLFAALAADVATQDRVINMVIQAQESMERVQ